MNDPGENLRQALLAIPAPDPVQVRALQELSYTAGERGLLPLDLDEEASTTVLKLVQLASRVGPEGIPQRLKM